MAFWNKIFGSHAEHTDDPIETILKNVRNETAVMLDVRSRQERDAGFLKDSLFIDCSQFQSINENSDWVRQLPKEKVIYCH